MEHWNTEAMECGNLSNCVRCVPFGNFPDSNFLVCKLCALCGQYFLNPIEQNPLRCRKPFCASLRPEAGKVSVHDLQRLGPVGFLMGEVGAPHQAIDVNLVAWLDTDAVELKTPKKVLAYGVTWQSLQWF